MVDLKLFSTYELWKDRSIKLLTRIDIISVESDTDSIDDLTKQIKYNFKDDVKESNIHNWKTEIIEIVKGGLDYFTIEELNKLTFYVQ